MLPTIQEECGLFLVESAGKPLIKSLPRSSDGYRRIKVRKKKHKDDFVSSFNETFFMEYNDIRNRAVFVNGNQIEDAEHEQFYIFPVDGYSFMYNPNVSDSSEEYKRAFHKLIESVGEEEGTEMFKDMLQYSYSYNNLPSAIDYGCEIIIYDISHYFAIRKTLIDNYTDWFKL